MNDYVDDDLIITTLLFAGLTPEDIQLRIKRRGSARGALESLKAPGESTDLTRKRHGLIMGYLDHLGTGNLEKLMAEGAGLDQEDVKAAIYWAQRDSGGTATPTLDSVLYHLGGATGRTKTQGAVDFAATVRPGLQTLGRADSGLMTTRTQYKTGTRPTAPQPPGAPAPRPAGAGGNIGASAEAPASTWGATPVGAPGQKPGRPTDKAGIMALQKQLGVKADGIWGPLTDAAYQKSLGGPAPAAPLAPGDTLAGPRTQPQQTPGIKNLPLLAKNAPPEEVDAYIRKHYGYSAWILDIPELREKLGGYVKEMQGGEISEERIEGILSSTDWWKTHEGDQRLAIEQRLGDPATYNKAVEGMFNTLGVRAAELGVNVPEGRLREMAIQAYEGAWKDSEIRAALAAEFDYDPTTGAQDQSKVVGDLRQLASDYLVPLSEQTIDQWGRQIVAGTSTNEDFTEYSKGIAKGMFAHYAPDIDAGRTVKQIADPFVQTAARDLELTADQIDLMDPKWRKALEMDAETGQPMQLSKWQRTIRSDSTYGWDTTQNARGEAAEFSKKIAEAFGRT